MNNQNIFSEKEEIENEERKQKLTDLIASGEAVLLVGAGSSARVDYPDWPGLLKLIEDKTIEMGYGFKPDNAKREKSPLLYAQEMKNYICEKHNEEKYHNLLSQSLKFMGESPRLLVFHKILVSLPFKSILTTNYDMVLEAALEDVGHKPAYNNWLIVHEDFKSEVTRYFRDINNQITPKRIVHLHGRYNHPKGIILSTEDYKKAYGFDVSNEISSLNLHNTNQWWRSILPNLQDLFQNWLPPSIVSVREEEVVRDYSPTLHKHFLQTLLSTRRLVFVGFGMNDPYFNEMLKIVSSLMEEWGEPIHYAIMGISSKTQRIQNDTKQKALERKRKYGVETIFYEVCHEVDDQHIGLEKLINQVAKNCGINISISQEDSVDPTNISDALLVWLEENNKKAERGIGDENN